MHVSPKSEPINHKTLLAVIPQIQPTVYSFQKQRWRPWKFSLRVNDLCHSLIWHKVNQGRTDWRMEWRCLPLYWMGVGVLFRQQMRNNRRQALTFFANTGLMALLCHHDHVLWLVNMTSAGEKQHYALVLVKHLFEHLPAIMTVGLLYDIECQLEHSCCKWKLLDDETLSRLKFGISVFHAYGHQWPCQIVYHLQKCVEFGLSDDEGCEHLWSSLKILIPILQVARVRVSLSIAPYCINFLSIIKDCLCWTIRLGPWIMNLLSHLTNG